MRLSPRPTGTTGPTRSERHPMTQTAAVTETGESLKELAHRHGLSSSGKLPSLPAYARQLWSYRHFITAYANARVSSALGTNHLGIFWQVLTPLFNAAVYYVIFGVILGVKAGAGNYIAMLCTGVFIYSFTAQTISGGANSVVGNLGMIRALQFPRAALPISTAIIEVRNLLASMSVLIVIVLLTGEPITLNWLQVIPALALQLVFNAGVGMFCARVTSKVIDFKQILPFILRIWMYLSAVLYPVQRLIDHAHGWKRQVVELNPLLVFIELQRHALLDNYQLTGPPLKLWLDALAWALVAGTIGFVFFWRGEKGYGRG
jgi:teichoic acid transport system permease protein